jgi:hypothetical protein
MSDKWEPSREEWKVAFKEAVKEWMDEKKAEVGGWTIKIIFFGALAMVFGWLYLHGMIDALTKIHPEAAQAAKDSVR